MSIRVNRSCSRYITSMATLLLNCTPSQVITATLYIDVLIEDQRLVMDKWFTRQPLDLFPWNYFEGKIRLTATNEEYKVE